jgi:ribonuclease P protein component
MLPKKYRIPKIDLIRVSHAGKRFPSENFTLTLLRNDLRVSRFAVRISVAVHKRAVIRNRIKRLYHESMRTILPTLTNPVDILCSVKRVPTIDTKKQITELLTIELKKIL